MSTLVILATNDGVLAEGWARQMPAGVNTRRLGEGFFPRGPTLGFSAVVVLDAVCEEDLPPALAGCPAIFVGEPGSSTFAQAKLSNRAKTYLSYEESAIRLGEFVPLLVELAERQGLVEMLKEKLDSGEPAPSRARSRPAESSEFWGFLEGAMENLDAPEHLLMEFRRASRHLLCASHVFFFQREADGFRADRGDWSFKEDDPLVAFFEKHPALIDGINWEVPADPVAELAVRNRLALWGARLLVPVHDHGRLLGLIALGVRDDGQAYDEMDRARAVFFGRLLRQFLGRSSQLTKLNQWADSVKMGAKYFPGTLLLGAVESPPRQVPLVVRDLVGQARTAKQDLRALPTGEQPFRVKVGAVKETGGVWATWEEASGEVHASLTRERATRRDLLCELALTMGHELGNALMSLATFRQLGEDRPMPAELVASMKNDVRQLEALNDSMALMQGLHEAEVAPFDVRELMQTLGHSLGVRVELTEEPVLLAGSRQLVDFALRAIVRTVGVNRPGKGLRELLVRLRSSGRGDSLTVLVSIKGKSLELEGILPEPMAEAVPNQGRIEVFLAKEIIRLHQGEIHAGPGLDGTEILLSLRKL